MASKMSTGEATPGPNPAQDRRVSRRQVCAGAVAGLTQACSVGSPSATFDTRREAERTLVDISTLYLRTRGHSAVGDGGGALFRRVTLEPQHPGKIRTSDGAWWQLEGSTTPLQFGARCDGLTDDSESLNSAFAAARALGVPVELPTGKMRLTREIRLPFGIRITGGEVSWEFDPGRAELFPNSTCVLADAGDARRLPPLASAALQGTTRIILAREADLNPGDLIALFNPADFSFSGYRPEYRAGEFALVREVAGRELHLWRPLAEGYPPDGIQVWRMPNARLQLEVANLQIAGSDRIDYTLRLRRLRDSRLSNITARNGRIAAFSVVESWGVTGQDLVAVQSLESGTGNDYGLALESSSHIDVSGDFRGYRHGVTTGSSPDLPGALTLPLRDIRINVDGGVIRNDAPDIQAFGPHGNIEDYRVGGTAIGGVLVAGNRSIIACRCLAGGPRKALIYGTEMHGWSHDLSGCSVLGDGVDPTPMLRGLIDFGGNGGVPDRFTVRGGTLNMRGLYIEAPDTVRPVKIHNAGSMASEPLVIRAGFRFGSAAPGAMIDIDIDAGTAVFELDRSGFEDRSGRVGWALDPRVVVRDGAH